MFFHLFIFEAAREPFCARVYFVCARGTVLPGSIISADFSVSVTGVLNKNV